MKELVEVIAKALVTNPDAVVVAQQTDGNEVSLTLNVAPEDMGKVIGKQGRIVKAIRTVLKVAATKEDKHVTLDVIE